MLTMLARTGGGSLWPLALIAGGALGLPCAIAARLAARLRGPDATSTP